MKFVLIVLFALAIFAIVSARKPHKHRKYNYKYFSYHENYQGIGEKLIELKEKNSQKMTGLN